MIRRNKIIYGLMKIKLRTKQNYITIVSMISTSFYKYRTWNFRSWVSVLSFRRIWNKILMAGVTTTKYARSRDETSNVSNISVVINFNAVMKLKFDSACIFLLFVKILKFILTTRFKRFKPAWRVINAPANLRHYLINRLSELCIR